MQFSLFEPAVQPRWEVGSFLIVGESGLRIAEPKEIFNQAAELAANQQLQREMFNTPAKARELFCSRLSGLEHEVFALVLLDCQHGFLDYVELFRGTLSQAAVYPREIVKLALERNAGAVLIAHNHPSGVLEPSQGDIKVTEQVRKALDLVDIKLLDHILVGGGRTLSFAERGLM